MRWLVLAAAGLALSGCALPPILTAASFALDFASYGATGKTMTDHGISMVLQEDCALLRGVEEGTVCNGEGYEFAARKPPKERETRASLQMAYLQEETNRIGAWSAALPDQDLMRQTAYAPDPAMTPNGGLAPARRQVVWLSQDLLGAAEYLADEARPLGVN